MWSPRLQLSSRPQLFAPCLELAPPMIQRQRCLPDYVDFRPLGRCNLACLFCYGPRHDLPTMGEDDAFRVVEILRAERVKGVVISGGEPTLLPYLARLAAALGAPYAPGEPGPKIVLSTNGLAPIPTMEKILPHLSWIALPLESADPGEHAAMRIGHARHRERVIALLGQARRSHPSVRIKLGTVVTRLNARGADRVLDLIEDDPFLPDIWKVYEMSETNYGADNRDVLALGPGEFEEVVRRCSKAAADRGVELRVYRNSTRSGNYFFVDPDGGAVVIDDGEERRLGSFFELYERGEGRLRACVEGDGNAANFTSTYPTWSPTGSQDAVAAAT
ncbi:radical SAM protein [Streptomyces montanus]|uniref:Radical SAM protein n=2 Tax=Streptomyces montanus TaxID=2580423 RepID=A0A5R9G0X4_9ACTN|nr:radical SAM protein [Streptomyces montanus]